MDLESELTYAEEQIEFSQHMVAHHERLIQRWNEFVAARQSGLGAGDVVALVDAPAIQFLVVRFSRSPANDHRAYCILLDGQTICGRVTYRLSPRDLKKIGHSETLIESWKGLMNE